MALHKLSRRDTVVKNSGECSLLVIWDDFSEIQVKAELLRLKKKYTLSVERAVQMQSLS